LKDVNFISEFHKDILHIYDSLFGMNFYFVKARTEKEFVSKIKPLIDIPLRENSENAVGSFRVINYDCFLWGYKPEDIAHECFHATHHVMKNAGIPLNNDTSEVYAYHLQFLMREIFRPKKGSKK